MEYVLPKQLKETHSISLKTVYNYLSNYPDKIRIKKEYGKRFIHKSDFTKILQGRIQNYKSDSNRTHPQSVKTDFGKQLGTIEKDFEKLQNEFKLVTIKSEQLTKQNRNLTEQANDLAVWLNEEKNAKKELEGKYDQLQENYNLKIESFSLEKITLIRRYYSVLSLALVSALVLFRIQIPALLFYFGN